MTNTWKKQEKPKRKGSGARILVLSGLLALAGVLLWTQQGGLFTGASKGGGSAAQPPATTRQPQPTAQGRRTLREEAYDKDMASLKALTENQGVNADIREDAAKRIEQMVAGHQTELAIDEALRGAGFAPSLTLLENGALTVMVEAQTLTGTQSATILSLCASHTDVGVENIRIMTGETMEK